MKVTDIDCIELVTEKMKKIVINADNLAEIDKRSSSVIGVMREYILSAFDYDKNRLIDTYIASAIGGAATIVAYSLISDLHLGLIFPEYKIPQCVIIVDNDTKEIISETFGFAKLNTLIRDDQKHFKSYVSRIKMEHIDFGIFKISGKVYGRDRISVTTDMRMLLLPLPSDYVEKINIIEKAVMTLAKNISTMNFYEIHAATFLGICENNSNVAFNSMDELFTYKEQGDSDVKSSIK